MKILVLVLSVLLVAGCENRTPRPRTDAALTEKVKVALEHEAQLGSDHVDVDSNSGVVTVKGSVRDEAAKQRIQSVVQKIKGVTWVQNQVSIAPRAG